MGLVVQFCLQNYFVTFFVLSSLQGESKDNLLGFIPELVKWGEVKLTKCLSCGFGRH